MLLRGGGCGMVTGCSRLSRIPVSPAKVRERVMDTWGAAEPEQTVLFGGDGEEDAYNPPVMQSKCRGWGGVWGVSSLRFSFGKGMETPPRAPGSCGVSSKRNPCPRSLYHGHAKKLKVMGCTSPAPLIVPRVQGLHPR